MIRGKGLNSEKCRFPSQTTMAVWFEKLVRQGVLLVGEHRSVFIYHPGYPHQKIANHWGTDVKHQGRFTRFYTTRSLDVQCMGFYVPATSLQHPQLQSRPLKSQFTVVAELLERMLVLGPGGSRAFNITPRISTWLLGRGRGEGQMHTWLHGSQENPPRRRKKGVQG